MCSCRDVTVDQKAMCELLRCPAYYGPEKKTTPEPLWRSCSDAKMLDVRKIFYILKGHSHKKV
jgi:hypothetical protein